MTHDHATHDHATAKGADGEATDGEATDGEATDGEGRVIEVEVEVPGTQDEVWAAIATGPGIGSWFVPTTIDERAGGEVVQQFGPDDTMTVHGRVRVWDPPRRVVFSGDADVDAGGLAFEWRVEARQGGTCVVRLVSSGFGSGAEWDGQIDGMDAGWRMFLQNLLLHRRFFPGQVPVAALPTVMASIGLDEAWTMLTTGLGIPTTVAAGDHLAVDTAHGAMPVALVGTVERATPRLLMLHTVEPGPGTAILVVEGADGQVAISTWFWLYGPTAVDRAPGVLEGWQRYLAELFAAP